MKKILLMTAVLATVGFAKAQSVECCSGTRNASVRSDGAIQVNGNTVGKITSDGRIEKSNGSSIGFIKSDGSVTNGAGSTIGYIKSDGTVENRDHSVLGYVKSDGTIENPSHSSMGRISGVDKKWAAVVYFFFKAN